jgi:hypothetical protein
MFKLAIGTVASAIVMMIASFLIFAGPLSMLAYSSAGENAGALVQQTLGANLKETGTYVIPDPSTTTGTTLYGNGPIATIHFNTQGFAMDSADGMIWGFVLFLIVSMLMAAGLSQIDRRVPDFRSRAIVVVLFTLAVSAFTILGDPIWLHQDWTYAIFNFVGSTISLLAGGLLLARWFMPQRAETAAAAPAPLPAHKVEETASAEEISQA